MSSRLAIGAIKDTAVRLGSLRTFNVYIDWNRRQPQSQTNADLKRDFHALNATVSYYNVICVYWTLINMVSNGKVVDCVHVAGKPVADKRMIVDLFVFGMENRPPAAIVVVSNDPDLAYTLSLLRQRGFHITLVSAANPVALSSTTGLVLSSQADEALSWGSLSAAQLVTTKAVNFATKPMKGMPRPPIPEHLRNIVTILRRVKKPRGWPDVAIHGKLGRKQSTKIGMPELTLHLREAVHLGILIESIHTSKGTQKLIRSYYAVAKDVVDHWTLV